jgi:hypothetical protein
MNTQECYRGNVFRAFKSLPEDYVFSSARNYTELDNELEVIRLEVFY